MSGYDLWIGSWRVQLGTTIVAGGANPATDARTVVDQLDGLLEAVCLRLGDDARAPLLRTLAATLAISGRESSLPLAALAFADPLRRALSLQADTIGHALAGWAAEANAARRGLASEGRERLSTLALRSRCEGHLWSEEATALLTGAAGGPVVMQLFNEWLHHHVILRDALLPFDNWQEVPVPRLRDLDGARETFLGRFLTRILTHASLVAQARTLFDPQAASGDEIYGFQSRAGLVLPALESGRPHGLLQWHPAALMPLPDGASSLGFAYRYADYLSAPRTDAGAGATAAPKGTGVTGNARIVADQVDATKATLALEVVAGGRSWRVDLGQSLRGLRFAYAPPAAANGRGPAPATAVRHDPLALLGLPGLVTAASGIHIVATGGDPVLALALLGKIYPENTVLAGAAAWRDILAAGKGYGARFVVS